MINSLFKTINIILFSQLLISCQQNDNISQTTAAERPAKIIEANGELASNNTAVISPPAVKNQWQYKITFLANEGSSINQGEPVVSFDKSQLTQELSIKMSELKTAQKTLENTHLTNTAKLEKEKLDFAEFNMKKDKEYRKWQQSLGLESNLETKKLQLQFQLADNDSKRLARTISKTEESNKIKLSIAQNEVKRLESEVNQVQTGISRMTITAPKSGIVIYKPDYQGQKVSSGDTVWMGRQIIELPSLDEMIVKAKITEAETANVTIGQSVEIILDAAPERIFNGKIAKLGHVFRPKSNEQPNVIFDAEITLEQTDPELMRPGMAARLKIKTDELTSNPNTEVKSES